MEKYIALVLLSSLGFIASAVAKFLGGIPSKRGEFDSVMSYATYSIFSISLSMLAAYGLGMFYLTETWSDIESKFKMPLFFFKFLGLSMICSIVIGASWQIKGKKALSAIFNKINKIKSGNIVHISRDLFNNTFNDGKEHFLVVKKDDKEIAIGFFKGTGDSERIELLIDRHSECKEWLEYARTKDPNHPLNKVIGVYIDITNDIVISEHDYPKEWATCSVLKTEKEVQMV